ncbi:monovalent cation/H+ antiporter subunit D family protein [Desulfosporosinus shakirovi]|uniref:monovalent cation/H+ antiporter subunit D family protein n=1 Tax=Desulfosporosinus shakirovi TaxID=2885154 RepID=UPI001E39E8B8|nr:monovalent cation/H+ antiporter subunit D family protein [Desulfosporosinus sp. SRJS8]MCB8816001.1 monovalent cation/H+ antiporter subunit D family protein [Desulfosporosinus sp. SRJS8]
MEIIESARPVYAILVSLLAVVLISFSGKSPNLREMWTMLAALLKFGLVVSMLPTILAGKVIEYHVTRVLPGLDIAFRVDSLGMVLALTASFLWIITSVYAIGYMRSMDEHAQTRFFMCFAIALSSAMGVAFSANVFTLFVFYEIITVTTFALVAHEETPEAIKGARRYLAYLLGTSIFFFLPAMFLTYNYAGTLDFAGQGILAGKASYTIISIIFVLYIAGIAKAGMMPFHSWLPAAMVAPTPVSALLHAVAVVKVGVFTVIRILLFVFGVDLLSKIGLGTYLAYFASFTIITASIMALRQDNLKLRLAYSTISQLSYIILAVALLTPSGITSSMMHITIHAFGKITLFFVAGAIYVTTHKKNVSELNGIGRQMPFTMAAFTIGSFSMIAVPPFGGFISKWYLIMGTFEAKLIPILIVIVVSTLLNAAYFLPIVYAAFFKQPESGEVHGIKEAPALMVAPILITAAGVLVLFFASPLLLNLVKIAVASALGGIY